jgi:hypothetical protein
MGMESFDEFKGIFCKMMDIDEKYLEKDLKYRDLDSIYEIKSLIVQAVKEIRAHYPHTDYFHKNFEIKKWVNIMTNQIFQINSNTSSTFVSDMLVEEADGLLKDYFYALKVG